jgi:parvulin-like peptidyl-prolyl isomerase
MDQPALVMLKTWGYGSLVRRETARDQLLSHEPPLNEEEKRVAISFICSKKKLKTQADVDRWRLSYLLSEDDFARLAEREFQWLKLCEKRFSSQASTLFLKRKSELDQVVYALAWVEDEAMAQEAFLQLYETEVSFDELLGFLPDPPSHIKTGLIGPIPMGELPEAFAELLRVSHPGQLWPPRKAEGGWILVRLEKLIPAVFQQSHRTDLILELGDLWLRDVLSKETQGTT